MNIISVDECSYKLIIIKDGNNTFMYRRQEGESEASWERLYGESWEPVFDCTDLEKVYQQYLASMI